MTTIAPQIKVTTDYQMFKLSAFNRSLDMRNVDKITKLTVEKNMLRYFPIVVTKEFEILDGQHRFEVNKKLSLPVFYVIDEDAVADFKTIHSLNKAGKKHDLADKLDMLNKQGDEGTREIYEVSIQFGNLFKLSSVAHVLTCGMSSGSLNRTIDEVGKVELANRTNGLDTLNALHNSSVPNKYAPYLVYALDFLSRKKKVSPEAILKRVEKNIIKWRSPNNTQNAKLILAECYNYGLSDQNRIIVKLK